MRSWRGLTGAAVSVGMVASLLMGMPAQALGPSTLPTEQSDPEAPEVTASEVDLEGVTIDPGYTSRGWTSEQEGDAQQQELIEAASAQEDPVTNSGIARIDLNSDISIVGVTWDSAVVVPERVDARYLTGGSWSEWRLLEEEVAPEDSPENSGLVGTEPLVLVDARAVEVVAYGVDGEMLDGLNVQVIDPRGAGAVENALDASDRERAAEEDPLGEETSPDEAVENPDADVDVEEIPAPVPDEEANQPEKDSLVDLDGVALTDNTSVSGLVPTVLSSDGTKFVTGKNGLVVTTRKGWGANESYRGGFVDINVKYQGAVIHHTAGNNNYTQAQVPGQIQGIYYYHAVTLGWGDIGYQLLVDKYGGVWEGRYGTLTSSPRGAQAYGANHETFGISVLGDYTSAAPPQIAQDSVAKAIAWQFGVRGIKSATGTISVPGVDLKGRTINVISGHRDVGGTACPGNAFYARIPSIRTQVASYMQTTTTPAPSVPVWKPGNVISDASFYNSNTMTEAQIQTFLNAQGAGCTASGGATCLKDTKFPTQNLTTLRGGCQPLKLSGNQSAAKIIYETSKSCGINPQVILATIQKEQSGITQARTAETWAKAMGSGCPTGQSCDAAQAGFTKQIYYGADKLASYKLDSSWNYINAFEKGTTVTVPNNVDAKCGTQSFKIENYATASLYMYTPYVGASSVAGCGAVGAKSFWDIMNRWFPASLTGGSQADLTPVATWQSRTQIGHGWSTFTLVYPGDWNRDGYPDLMGIDAVGRLWLYEGIAGDGFRSKKQIGNGWQVMDSVIGSVDWDGDGNPDLIARERSTGRLLLYPGNGAGGFKQPRQIGNGWQVMRDITVVQRAGTPVIYAMDQNRIYAYPGDGRGGFRSRIPMGTGWDAFDRLEGVGDWTGDGVPDVSGRTRAGVLYLYPGRSDGTLGTAIRIGQGWQAMKDFGVSSTSAGLRPIWSTDTSGLLWKYPFVGMR